jgi:hypothetical protein
MKKKHSPDPLIDEVRERRRQLWAHYDNDLNKVDEAIKRLQAQHPEKLGRPETVAEGEETMRWQVCDECDSGFTSPGPVARKIS